MIRAILPAAIAAIVVATLGAVVTDLGVWYYALKKPPWQPPDWLFGPVWTTIFVLAAASGVLGWTHARSRAGHVRLLVLFAVNAALNVGWSVLFFRLHRPDWALAEVGFLWLSIALMMAALWRDSRLASALLTPYLGWVTFASVLNYAIVRLNAPFG